MEQLSCGALNCDKCDSFHVLLACIILRILHYKVLNATVSFQFLLCFGLDKVRSLEGLFRIQGRHDAPKYNGTNGDILDFAIYAKSDSSVLRMFSLSRIHGALGDNGQNFKSLQLGVTIFQ